MELSEETKSLLSWTNRICKLALTAPAVTTPTASNERLFSKMKIIKYYLRSKTANEKLHSPIVLLPTVY